MNYTRDFGEGWGASTNLTEFVAKNEIKED
jgi:hypothetical protein